MTENSDAAPDPWWGKTTANGLPTDEIRSSVQKYVRRGQLEEAVLAAYELYVTGEDTEELLWRRLEVMAAEDVGLGDPGLPAVIEALQQQRLRFVRSGDRWLFAAHAVRLLVIAQKDRTTAELADWAAINVGTGSRPARVIDVAVDMHTRRGTAMGRGPQHFFSEGNVVAHEIPDRDTTWLEQLRAHHGVS